MKIVAAIFLTLLVATTGPTTLASHPSSSVTDECVNQISPQTGRGCVRVDLPPQTPSAVGSKTGDHLYVLMPVPGCASTTTCYPASDTQSFLTCNAAGCTQARLGVVYAETNGVAGLQTHSKFIGGIPRPADMALLV